jgi:tetratricopeptide (TPR) repeat protein
LSKSLAAPLAAVVALVLGLCSAAASTEPPVELPPEPKTKDSSERAQWLVAVGDAWLSHGVVPEACAAYEGAVKLLPPWWIARLNAARCGRMMGAPMEAVEAHLQAAIRSFPRGAILFVHLGQLYEDWGEVDKARAAYGSALQLAAWMTEPRRRLAELARAAGDAERARQELEALVEAAPSDLQARNVLAEVYAQLGRKEEAALQLEAVARGSRFPISALARLERLYAEMGATEHLTRVRKLLGSRRSQ